MEELSDEAEARRILAQRIEELIALGPAGLRARLGEVKRSWAGGRVRVYEGGAPAEEEVTAPSGRRYQLEIAIEDLGEELDVSVELFEDSRADLPTLLDGFEMSSDGSVRQEPAS